MGARAVVYTVLTNFTSQHWLASDPVGPVRFVRTIGDGEESLCLP